MICTKCHTNPRQNKSRWCKECKSEASRIRYQEKRAEIIANVSKWSKENPDKRKKYERKYRETHREYINKRSYEYYHSRGKHLRSENWDKYKGRALELRYGITLDERNVLEKEQNGRCAICGEKNTLVVDHCHDSGAIRALLCQTCNRGIGQFRDDTDLMRKAIEYIEHFRTCPEHPKNKV